jgi:hypothetical protein
MRKFKFTHVSILLLTVILALTPIVMGQELEVPRQIILTWQNNPQTTMTVTWRTDHQGTSGLYYSSEPGQEDKYLVAETFTFEETAAWVHTVEITDLNPGTTYWVTVETDGVQAEEFNFRTAPSESEDLLFVMGADAQHLRTQMHVIQEVFKQAATEDPDAFIYSGDFVNAELSDYEWDLFFDLWHDLMITKEGKRIPIIPAIGNHEVVAGFGGTKELAVFYYNRFQLPDPETYHVLQYGPDFTIVSLDSYHTSTIEEQVPWLEATLQDHQDSSWTLVHYHAGSWWGTDILDAKIRTYLVPLYEEYGVDVVHSGHNHTYNRLTPISGIAEIVSDINTLIADGLARAQEDFDPSKNYAPPLQKDFLQLSRGNWEQVGFDSITEGFAELSYMISLFVIQTDEPTFEAVFNQVASTKLYQNLWAPILSVKENPEFLANEKGTVYLVGGGLGAEMGGAANPEKYWWLEEANADHHYRRVVLDVAKNELRIEPVFYYPEDGRWEEADAITIKK